MRLGICMTSYPEVMSRDSRVIFEKSSEFRFETKRVGIRIWARPVQLFAAGCARVCWVSELRADAGRSQHIKNCVSLSSCLKPKSQEGNKSFIPKPRESSVFRDSYACERFTYQYICIFVYYGYISNSKKEL